MRSEKKHVNSTSPRTHKPNPYIISYLFKYSPTWFSTRDLDSLGSEGKNLLGRFGGSQFPESRLEVLDRQPQQMSHLMQILCSAFRKEDLPEEGGLSPALFWKLLKFEERFPLSKRFLLVGHGSKPLPYPSDHPWLKV